MEALQKLLGRLAAQLRSLTLSQRLAIVLGGVLVAVSVIWMIRWAATPEMVPLLDQDLAADELARVRGGLDSMNEPFRLVGQKVLVRADANRAVLLARLQQDDKLPADTSVTFDALVKESNPWISQAEHERRWAVALKNEIEKVLRQFEGVKSASVFLPLTSQSRSFSRTTAPASASVTLAMHGGQTVSRELAVAAARLVAGAVRGLSIKNVEVVDSNGVSALDWDSEASGLAGLDRKRRAEEQAIQRKILNQLPDPKALVSVQAELELTNQNVETETPNKAIEISSEATNEETARVREASPPGVQMNVGLTAGGRAADERTTRTSEKSESRVGVTREVKATLAGGIKEIWAAVNISHGYLESVYRRANPAAGAPTEQQIQEVFDREKPRIVSQVSKLVKPQDETHVAVEWYYETSLETEPAGRASAVDDAYQLVRRYAPQSGLALLALLSLGLMLRMARRSDASEAFGLEIGLPKEAVEAAQRAARDATEVAQRRTTGQRGAGGSPGARGATIEGAVEVDPQAVGQAAATEGVLVAQEVDEKTVQTHKMIEQVAQVVERDPEAVSALLEQWVQRSDAYPG